MVSIGNVYETGTAILEDCRSETSEWSDIASVRSQEVD